MIRPKLDEFTDCLQKKNTLDYLGPNSYGP